MKVFMWKNQYIEKKLNYMWSDENILFDLWQKFYLPLA